MNKFKKPIIIVMMLLLAGSGTLVLLIKSPKEEPILFSSSPNNQDKEKIKKLIEKECDFLFSERPTDVEIGYSDLDDEGINEIFGFVLDDLMFGVLNHGKLFIFKNIDGNLKIIWQRGMFEPAIATSFHKTNGYHDLNMFVRDDWDSHRNRRETLIWTGKEYEVSKIREVSDKETKIFFHETYN